METRDELCVNVDWRLSERQAEPNAADAPVNPVLDGPLAVSSNPRYFADRHGRALILGGSHPWNNLQDWGTGVTHLGVQRASVGRDAEFRTLSVGFGADLARTETEVVLGEPGGFSEQLGVFFADGEQHPEQAVLHRRRRVSNHAEV